MSKVKIQGNASGTGVVTLTAPNTNTDRTITLPDGTGDIGMLTKATTAPSSPAQGDMWFDTTSGVTSMKVWSGAEWDQMSNKFSATGGTESTYSSGGVNYKVHTFTSSGTFTTTAPGSVDYLVVAGGGTGNNGWINSAGIAGGGGGAGGYLTGNISITTGSHSITVGAGGAWTFVEAASASGNDSSIGSSVVSLGGGGGGKQSRLGGAGGSGGGGGGNGQAGGAGTSGQGNAGGTGVGNGTGGGGGGAGGAGGAPTSGIGLSSSINGSAVTRSVGGTGGTGAGNGAAGASNTGNGGNGSGAGSAAIGSNGGSGIVIIRYAV